MEKRLARHDAKRQAARIDACPALAPQTDEGRNEVTECLMRNCQDAEHARLVVTRLLDDVLECQNLTAEIAIIAQATRKQDPLPPGCNRCKGEPFIGGPDGLWTRCTCARGQALRARDRSLDDPRGQPNRRRPVLSGTGVRQHLRNPKIEAESAGRSQTTPAPCVWLKLWRAGHLTTTGARRLTTSANSWMTRRSPARRRGARKTGIAGGGRTAWTGLSSSRPSNTGLR
jgi:hypothetical protein